MDKQFEFAGRRPKVTIEMNDDGSCKVDWAGITPVIFYGMVENAKVAFADHCKVEQVKAAIKGN